MKVTSFPKRVFNSPLIKYANFKDGGHVNLIRLIKPYSNGYSYAVHQTLNSPMCFHGLFKTEIQALKHFSLLVECGKAVSELIEEAEIVSNK